MKPLRSLVFVIVAAAIAAGDGRAQTAEPSFDCSKAITPTERAICSSETLATLDRALADAYKAQHRQLAGQERTAFSDRQRAWMQYRNQCGGDQACLERLMSSRLETLTTVSTDEAKVSDEARKSRWELVYNLVGPAVLVTVLGFLGWPVARWYDQYAARKTMQRRFIEATTNQVADLSSQHYWAMANSAGILAGKLKEYLASVEKHLFLNYTNPDEFAGVDEPREVAERGARRLQQRIKQVAREATDETFPELVRLIDHLQRFQFSGSNTYLLPNHSSGEALRRLYNRFATSMPQGEFLATIRNRVETFKHDGRKSNGEDEVGKDAENSLPFLEDPQFIRELGLQETKELWKHWMTNSLPEVYAASEALEAYANLIAHELAHLNEVFFRDRTLTDSPEMAPDQAHKTLPRSLNHVAGQWFSGEWPALLDEATLLAIARSDYLPRSYVPLGSVAETAIKAEPLGEERPQEESKAKDEPTSSAASTLEGTA